MVCFKYINKTLFILSKKKTAYYFTLLQFYSDKNYLTLVRKYKNNWFAVGFENFAIQNINVRRILLIKKKKLYIYIYLNR